MPGKVAAALNNVHPVQVVRGFCTVAAIACSLLRAGICKAYRIGTASAFLKAASAFRRRHGVVTTMRMPRPAYLMKVETDLSSPILQDARSGEVGNARMAVLVRPPSASITTRQRRVQAWANYLRELAFGQQPPGSRQSGFLQKRGGSIR